jgi:hypothetical protein
VIILSNLILIDLLGDSIHVNLHIYNNRNLPPYDWRVEDTVLSFDESICDDDDECLFKVHEKNSACPFFL